MPALPLKEPVEKTTVRFYSDDLAFLKDFFGYGWTGEMREHIRRWVLEIQNDRFDKPK